MDGRRTLNLRSRGRLCWKIGLMGLYLRTDRRGLYLRGVWDKMVDVKGLDLSVV